MPEKKEDKKTVRIRERQTTEPQGFARKPHVLVRVVETTDPVPAGAEETTDSAHGWRKE